MRYVCILENSQENIVLTTLSDWLNPWGSLVSIFAGYVPLASQSPYSIIAFIIGPIVITFGNYSLFLVYLIFVANYRPYLSKNKVPILPEKATPL